MLSTEAVDGADRVLGPDDATRTADQVGLREVLEYQLLVLELLHLGVILAVAGDARYRHAQVGHDQGCVG